MGVPLVCVGGGSSYLAACRTCEIISAPLGRGPRSGHCVSLGMLGWYRDVAPYIDVDLVLLERIHIAVARIARFFGVLDLIAGRCRLCLTLRRQLEVSGLSWWQTMRDWSLGGEQESSKRLGVVGRRLSFSTCVGCVQLSAAWCEQSKPASQRVIGR